MLVGFLVHGTTVEIALFDTSPASENIDGHGPSSFRLMTAFDLSDGDHDWNPLALALVVMKIRKTMLGHVGSS